MHYWFSSFLFSSLFHLITSCSFILYFHFYSSEFVCVSFFVCFNQKTAYEVRISDCSSDVCSSDLIFLARSRYAEFRLDRRDDRKVTGSRRSRDGDDAVHDQSRGMAGVMAPRAVAGVIGPRGVAVLMLVRLPCPAASMPGRTIAPLPAKARLAAPAAASRASVAAPWTTICATRSEEQT